MDSGKYQLNNLLSDLEYKMKNKILILSSFLLIWILIYLNLNALTDFLVYSIIGLEKDTHLTNAIWFFIYEVPKVLLLLVLVVFAVGIIRSYFSPERTRKILGGKSLFTGNVLASSLGVVTPFCSCSAIPLFLGFVQSGVPLGVTFSFLIAAPMINEVALVLLFGLFGWQTALLYAATGLFIAICAGYVIGRLNLERFVEGWVYETKAKQLEFIEEKITFEERIESGIIAVKEIVAKVWIYIVIGNCSWCRHSWICTRKFYGITYGQICLVVCSTFSFNWYSNVFQRSRNNSHCAGTFGKRSFVRNGSCIYDERDWFIIA